MEIIRKSGELTKKDIYNLSRSPEIQKMRDHVDEIIDVGKYMIYSDTSGNDDEVTVLSVEDRTTGAVIASNSATARNEFEYIADLMENEEFSIKVCSGTSKNGRSYITVALI